MFSRDVAKTQQQQQSSNKAKRTTRAASILQPPTNHNQPTSMTVLATNPLSTRFIIEKTCLTSLPTNNCQPLQNRFNINPPQTISNPPPPCNYPNNSFCTTFQPNIQAPNNNNMIVQQTVVQPSPNYNNGTSSSSNILNHLLHPNSNPHANMFTQLGQQHELVQPPPSSSTNKIVCRLNYSWDGILPLTPISAEELNNEWEVFQFHQQKIKENQLEKERKLSQILQLISQQYGQQGAFVVLQSLISKLNNTNSNKPMSLSELISSPNFHVLLDNISRILEAKKQNFNPPLNNANGMLGNVNFH